MAAESSATAANAPVLRDGRSGARTVCDGVTVDAIAESDDEDWSFASLAGADGKRRFVRRTQEVAGKTVYFIGWNEVWLAGSDGLLCQVNLNGEARPPAPVASAASPVKSGAKPLAANLKKGIQQVSATEFNIDRGVVDKILENQAELMRQARIVPEQENGKVVGIRLFGVRPDTLLGSLGMENGDRLEKINGFDMASPEKALEAYARLRTADKLRYFTRPRRQDVNLDFNIK